MILSEWRSSHLQRLITLASVLLLVGALSLVMPLSSKDRALSAKLEDQWRELRSRELNQSGIGSLDVDRIRNQLERLHSSDFHLNMETPFIRSRVRLDPVVQKRMTEPFQLIDYINEYQLKIEDIEDLAQKKKATLDKSILNSFPEHTSDRENPEFLWAELEVTYQTVLSALNCGIKHISLLKANEAVEVNSFRGSTGSKLIEIPLKMKVSGTMEGVYLFLHSLPLRADEVATLQLPAAHKEKPSLFIKRILILKNSSSNPDSVEMDITISGLIYTESIL